ncbi:hypothetical protein SAMN02746065_101302 [Desulfocicer vacuolatum DSM 3385]|uniref:Uncharacterized protein n=1 Tax=Desulfocicer vacuolatum DSM 3385 TaxID=1121400 RepID=A0A1W1YS49_9BACT|nr:hypothetical protein SAMN02746065_101302 [Desulfocicer vacuolatum DSM 3385]
MEIVEKSLLHISTTSTLGSVVLLRLTFLFILCNLSR